MSLGISIYKNRRDTTAGNKGILKEINGVNGVPVSIAPGFPSLEDQFNQMGITHIRLHDTFGIGDIDNYFQPSRYFNQDQLIPNIPSNLQQKGKQLIADIANKRTIFPYAAEGMKAHDINTALKNANYQMTDKYLIRILNNKPELNPGNIERQVMFRVGRTLDGGYELPQDFDIYSALVGKLADRYSLNYKKTGLPRKIKYWEIWNEPDLTFFWNNNNPEKYYEFYSKVAKAIKAVDPSAKVGGAGAANGLNPGGAYLDGLLAYCQKNNTPIDFLSWHYYGHLTCDPQNIIDLGNSIQKTLDQYGYSNIESICTEWNSTPFGSINVFTKVQSAQNAAYIASSLICMQHCKVDKAYYYRGDASSFGLFNDSDNPKAPQFKNFCTHAAQSFNLFARMFETPFIISHDDTLSTGISILAGENAKGNKLNILASNYKIDKDFSTTNPPKGIALYRQHYLDTSRTINQLTDQWGMDEWFGGLNPTTITTNNAVTQNTNIASQLPVNDKDLKARARNYTLSDTGLILSIKDIPSDFKGYKLIAYRIKEGGPLDKMLPEDVTASVSANLANNVLTIKDVGLIPSTVALYTIEFL